MLTLAYCALLVAADIASEYGDNVADSVDFLMLNFAGRYLVPACGDHPRARLALSLLGLSDAPGILCI